MNQTYVHKSYCSPSHCFDLKRISAHYTNKTSSTSYDLPKGGCTECCKENATNTRCGGQILYDKEGHNLKVEEENDRWAQTP